MAKTNYVKKLSVASIGGIPKDFKKEAHDYRLPIMNVFGRVENTENGVSQFGPWVAFVGSFKAVMLNDGEVYRASKCLLPGLASDAIESAVNEADGQPLEFAIEIGLRRIVKLGATGEEMGACYEYTMKPLIEMDAASDPLAALESRVQASLPAPAQSNLPIEGTVEVLPVSVEEQKPAKAKK